MAAPIQSYSKHSDNAMNHLSDYTYQRCCKCSLAKPVAATTICMHQAEPPYNNDLPEKITLTFQGNHCCTAARLVHSRVLATKAGARCSRQRLTHDRKVITASCVLQAACCQLRP